MPFDGSVFTQCSLFNSGCFCKEVCLKIILQTWSFINNTGLFKQYLLILNVPSETKNKKEKRETPLRNLPVYDQCSCIEQKILQPEISYAQMT